MNFTDIIARPATDLGPISVGTSLSTGQSKSPILSVMHSHSGRYNCCLQFCILLLDKISAIFHTLKHKHSLYPSCTCS